MAKTKTKKGGRGAAKTTRKPAVKTGRKKTAGRKIGSAAKKPRKLRQKPATSASRSTVG